MTNSATRKRSQGVTGTATESLSMVRDERPVSARPGVTGTGHRHTMAITVESPRTLPLGVAR